MTTSLTCTTPPEDRRGDRLIDGRAVEALTGLFRPTIWRLRRLPADQDPFPAPIQLMPSRITWWESDVLAWLSRRPVVGAHGGEAA